MMNRLNNPFKIILILVFSVAIGWAVYLYKIPAKDTIWNYLYNLVNAVIYLIGGAAGIYYAISPRMPQNLRKTLMYYGLGQLSWSMAALLWSYFNIFLRIEIPYPSLNDVFFIAFMFFISIGSIYLMKHYDTRITRKSALESAIIIMIAYVAVLFVASPPDLSPNLAITTMMFNFIYPLSDAFMLSLAIVIFRTSEKNLAASAWYMMLGLLFQAVGDFVFGYLTAAGMYWNGDISDIVYALSGFLISAGIISLASRNTAALKESKS